MPIPSFRRSAAAHPRTTRHSPRPEVATRLRPVRRFVDAEDGAATVDWVLLSAGLVGMALASMALMSEETMGVSEDVATTLDAPARLALPFEAEIGEAPETPAPAAPDAETPDPDAAEE